jgi:glycine cleavage system regulatory protein
MKNRQYQKSQKVAFVLMFSLIGKNSEKIVFTQLHFKLYRGHHVVLLNLKTNRYISKQNNIVVFDENLTIFFLL